MNWKNPEEVRAYYKRYHETHDKREYWKAYHRAHKKKEQAYRLAYRLAHGQKKIRGPYNGHSSHNEISKEDREYYAALLKTLRAAVPEAIKLAHENALRRLDTETPRGFY